MVAPIVLAALVLAGRAAEKRGLDPHFTEKLFREAAERYDTLDAAGLYQNNTDLRWVDTPRAWHQQLARITDYRFRTMKELVAFAMDAKRAGVGALMLIQIQKTAQCPGSWYNGLQLCDHINGTFPAADGTIEEWRSMLSAIKPMRLMWWINPTYWSVQGQVWADALADRTSDVGRFFSWDAKPEDQCFGSNPCEHGVCAQGSWGSDGIGKGYDSALASFCSPTYASYMVDALANSWTRNLGIDGYTVDCSGNYVKCKACASGMLQCPNGDGFDAWSSIIGKVRQIQPQTVFSGEDYGSWAEVIQGNADMGGQGNNQFHTATQAAVIAGDVSRIEDIVSTTGADAATVLCYTNPYYDGKQPGACPTMYFRDMTATLTDIRQHELWVALEAGSGIVSEHDYDAATGKWWNVTNDPSNPNDGESPLIAFSKFRALNRLALRTKLSITSSRSAQQDTSATPAYTRYAGQNCYNGFGGIEIDSAPIKGLSTQQCQQRCTDDVQCDCVVYIKGSHLPTKQVSPGDCWRRSRCIPAHFENDNYTKDFTVYVKTNGPTPPPKTAGGALAYLKHDSLGPHGDAAIMIFNPGPAQTVTLDLSMLPSSVFGKATIDLLNSSATAGTLEHSWPVHMPAMTASAFSGFSLGVFAPRLGKKAACKSDDGFSQQGQGKTLQACFLECLSIAECSNVFIDFVPIVYMETPPDIKCTLLGVIANPDAGCARGTGTLIAKLPNGRPQ